MQAAFEDMSWIKRSRFMGALRYHCLWLARAILLLLGLLLLSQVFSIVLALTGVGDSFRMPGMGSDPGTTILLSLICGCAIAGKKTRFLIRFGTPRLSVWLSSVIALIVGMALYLVGTLAVSGLTGLLTLALSRLQPDRFFLSSYAFSEQGLALLGRTCQNALGELPKQLLFVAEFSCLFYLLGCCLRKNKGLTLAVVIGVPLALAILLLVPAVNDTINALESGSTGEMTVAALNFVSWLQRTVVFIDREWPTIQLLLALLSLPLSYLCMRSTAQP